MKPSDPQRLDGIFRDGSNERVLCLMFRRRPTDDEMRAIHDLLRDHDVVHSGNKRD